MPETTETYLRVPQHPDTAYTATRQGTLSAADGIDALYGQRAGSETWEIRTLLFRRDAGWTWDTVRTWITQHEAFHMAEDPDLFADLLGVEVFRPGTWKGETYTSDDMDRVAANSNAMLPYFQAKLHLSPIKLTHDDDQPKFIRNAALGIATKYYTKIQDGLKRVYADFRKVPTVLAEAIDRFFPERSVEKYRYFPHPETKRPIPDVIRSVAFLGHVPPEVKGMFNRFQVLYEEDEQERSEVSACYAWRVTDDPTDVVFTQDTVTHTESAAGEAPLTPDSKEATMPEEQEQLLIQDPQTDDSVEESPAASVEDAPQSDDSQPQTPTTPSDPSVATPETDEDTDAEMPESTPSETPPGVSDAALQEAREAGKQEVAQDYAEKITQYEERLARLEAEKRETEVSHYLESLHLPESFRKVGVHAFLLSLDRDHPQQFAEDGPEQTQYDQAKAILAEVQKYWEIYTETLSSEQAPAEAERRRNHEQQRADIFEELQGKHPDLPATEIMKLAAEQRPELFKEEDDVA